MSVRKTSYIIQLIIFCVLVVNVTLISTLTYSALTSINKNDQLKVIEMVFYVLENSKNAMNNHINTDKLIDNFIDMNSAYTEVTITPDPASKLQLKVQNIPDLNYDDLSFSKIEMVFNRIFYKEDNQSFISIYVPSLTQWVNIKVVQTAYPLSSILFIFVQICILLFLLTYIWSNSKLISPLNRLKVLSHKLSIKYDQSVSYHPFLAKNSALIMEEMIKKIEEFSQERITTMAALSHDIKTPLTRARLYVHFIEDIELQDKITEQLCEIEYFLNQSLSYAKNDFKEEKFSELDIILLVREIAQAVAEDSPDSIQIFPSKKTSFMIKGQRINLKRAFRNLIENAIKYGGKVYINIESSAKVPCIVNIYDDGPGIPEDKLALVLQPFYRLDESRSSKIKGSGLGLCIAQTIFHNHNIDMVLKNRIDKKSQKVSGLAISVIFHGSAELIIN